MCRQTTIERPPLGGRWEKKKLEAEEVDVLTGASSSGVKSVKTSSFLRRLTLHRTPDASIFRSPSPPHHPFLNIHCCNCWNVWVGKYMLEWHRREERKKKSFSSHPTSGGSRESAVICCQLRHPLTLVNQNLPRTERSHANRGENGVKIKVPVKYSSDSHISFPSYLLYRYQPTSSVEQDMCMIVLTGRAELTVMNTVSVREPDGGRAT